MLNARSATQELERQRGNHQLKLESSTNVAAHPSHLVGTLKSASAILQPAHAEQDVASRDAAVSRRRRVLTRRRRGQRVPPIPAIRRRSSLPRARRHSPKVSSPHTQARTPRRLQKLPSPPPQACARSRSLTPTAVGRAAAHPRRSGRFMHHFILLEQPEAQAMLLAPLHELHRVYSLHESLI
jgi:hypothetical protein